MADTQKAEKHGQWQFPVVVYIKPDEYTQVEAPGNGKTKQSVCIQDVAQVFCVDESIKKQVERLSFMNIETKEYKKYAVSVMTLVEKIESEITVPVLVQNVGENDFLISIKEKKQSKWKIWIKVVFVLLITFFGSVFAIMAYNEDVDVSSVFDRIYKTLYGKTRVSPGIMELFYCIGVALGVIVFFNHFGKKKLTSDPTPMEVEMEKYETDIDDTLIKEISRRQKGV